ncbi:MAG: glycosyltransferase family 39 protein [Candidatus Pacebacteria bacterium]|nr:glycosyltransferase family 39 protein [Candidatus Paceibacterota bacterium]
MKKTIFSAPFLIISLVASLSLFLMLSAAKHDSAIMDELAHIPSGYSYDKYLDFRLNPEHPPLLKSLSALPLLFMDLNFPLNEKSWQEEINSQWWVGTQFIFESGNNADTIIFWSRLAPILLTILLIFLIYFWSAKLLGKWWGILPAFLFAFSPTVLAHGHYVTTDLAATFGIFASTFSFLNFLAKPNKKNLIVAGLTFGMAQLLKFSAVLLVPFFILIALIHFFVNLKGFSRFAPNHKIKFFLKKAGVYILWLFSIFFIGFLLIYAVYFIFTFNYPIERQVGDTREILTSFAGSPTPVGETCSGKRCLADLDIWLAGNSLTRPAAEYLLGVLMVMQRSSGGNTAFFLGEVGGGGWWYYFPVVFLLKETLPVLLLILFSLISATLRLFRSLRQNRIKIIDYLNTNFAEFSLLVFVIFYWVYSINSPLNIGVRHIMPTIPFIYILSVSALKKHFFFEQKSDSFSWFSQFFKTINLISKNANKLIILFAVLLWFSIESALAYPNYLSYFNELGGGTKNGFRFVTDSNYDWGQDLKELAIFVEKNNIDKIAVDYFGGDSLAYRFGNKAVPWQSAKNNPKEEGINWLAVSVNTLEGAVADLAPGMELSRKPEDSYLWLKNLRNVPENYSDVPLPDYRAGTSIFIYKL